MLRADSRTEKLGVEVLTSGGAKTLSWKSRLASISTAQTGANIHQIILAFHFVESFSVPAQSEAFEGPLVSGEGRGTGIGLQVDFRTDRPSGQVLTREAELKKKILAWKNHRRSRKISHQDG